MFTLNAPCIQTQRLVIRLVDLIDEKAYFEFCSDEDVCKYLTFNPYTHHMQAKNAIKNMIRAYLQGSDVNFSIILKENNQVIGSISLTYKEPNSAEVGYILNKYYWKNGIMDEALKALISACKDYYKLDFLMANYLKDNIASEKLLRKNNFNIYAIENNGFVKNGIAYDLCKTILKLNNK